MVHIPEAQRKHNEHHQHGQHNSDPHVAHKSIVLGIAHAMAIVRHSATVVSAVAAAKRRKPLQFIHEQRIVSRKPNRLDGDLVRLEQRRNQFEFVRAIWRPHIDQQRFVIVCGRVHDDDIWRGNDYDDYRARLLRYAV